MNQLHRIAAWTLALLVTAAACYLLYLSLDNPVRADLAMLHYSGYLMQEKGFLLYRDILEINFPAPFLLHQWLGSFIGYEALPLRLLDFASIALMAFLSWRILKPLSPASAVLAPALFVLFYQMNGAEYTLERDYLVVFPSALAFLCACSSQLRHNTVALLVGALCGIACSIKPNAIVLAPAAFAVWAVQNPVLRQPVLFIRMACISALVFLLTLAVPFVVIQQQGVLQDFLELYRTFLPIYARTRYDLYHYANASEYWTTLVRNYGLYGGISVLLAAPGLLWAGMNLPDRTRVYQLAIMVFAFTLYEVIAGKFWASHMMPSAYWTLVGFSLLVIPLKSVTPVKSVTPIKSAIPSHTTRMRSVIAATGLLMVASLGTVLSYASLLQMQAYVDQQQQGNNRATKVARYLRDNLRAGDTVQTLDYAGDGQACLLESRATVATRFLIDVPLYLQPDSPATQALRKEFMASLAAKPPTFIVYFENMLHPGGGNRLREVRELYGLIEDRYSVDSISEGEYTIYRLTR